MKNKLVELLTFLDIYSVGVHLNFKQSERHKSIFGGIISIASFICISFVIWLYAKELYTKQNPIIISSLREVSQAHRIDVNKNNIIMMIGVQDQFSSTFTDPTLFQVSAKISQLVLTTNPVTGLINKSLVFTQRKIAQCTLNDIGIGNLVSYFTSFDYTQYYCLQSNDTDQDNYIEGDFDESSFSQIYIEIQQCTNSTLPDSVVCKSKEEIDQQFNTAYVSIYLSDKLVVPTQFEEPFQDKAINLYSPISNQFQKEIQLYYTNSYIDSDVGIITEDIQSIRQYSFVQSKEVLFHDNQEVVCRVLLRLRKQKEDYMQRRYQKIFDIAGQVGGLLKIITMIGALLVAPIQRFHFNKRIVNEIFSFNTQENPEMNSSSLDNDKSTNLLNLNRSFNQSPLQKSATDKSMFNNTQDCINETNSSNVNKLRTNKRKENILSNILKKFKVTSQGIQYALSDYVTHFFCPRNSIKKPLIDFSIKKVHENLDILHILNKLIEIDKLKYILFDEDQLKLFEYIPKPKINIFDIQENISPEKENEEIKIENRPLSKTEENKSPTKLDETNYQDRSDFKNMKYKQPRFYFEADKSLYQKADDGLKSLLKIYNKNDRSKIDQKLLNIVDPNLFILSTNINQMTQLIAPTIYQQQTLDLSNYNFPLTKNLCSSQKFQLLHDNFQLNHKTSQKIAIVPSDIKESLSESKENKLQTSIIVDKGIFDLTEANEYDQSGINIVKNNTNFFDSMQNKKKIHKNAIPKIQKIYELKYSKSLINLN